MCSFCMYFYVRFEAGSICHYKICSLDPHCNGAATVDAHSSWECFLKVQLGD